MGHVNTVTVTGAGGTFEQVEISVCEDCYYYFANGEPDEPSPGWSPEAVAEQWPEELGEEPWDLINGPIPPDFDDPEEFDREDLVRAMRDAELQASDRLCTETLKIPKWWDGGYSEIETGEQAEEAREWLNRWWEEEGYEAASEGHFSWHDCDGCGSTIGGDRYPAVAMRRKKGPTATT